MATAYAKISADQPKSIKVFDQVNWMKPLVFQGHRFLRQRLLLSVLSGIPIKVEKIRAEQSQPGLKGTIRVEIHSDSARL